MIGGATRKRVRSFVISGLSVVVRFSEAHLYIHTYIPTGTLANIHSLLQSCLTTEEMKKIKTMLTETFKPDASMSAAEKATREQGNTETMAQLNNTLSACSTQTLTAAQATELNAYHTAVIKAMDGDQVMEKIVAGKICLSTKWDFKCVFFSANIFSKPNGIKYLLGLI